ncbi:TolC family protein [Haloflavibacter putidus]|uniref:TolC family protein n=1 Tax=Haloflavibacter putidus TaxID=2576776 RepID=A0A507ZN03_9FLAO|nr:TolC family protein [Haloflavibacter putidus]TQD36265.1 TolC family protein [Haloflavibacter putidus]
MIKVKLINAFRLQKTCFPTGVVLLVMLLFFSWNTNGQHLNNYIEKAVNNNPDIQAIKKQYAISAEKITASKSLPNTKFSGGYMFSKEDMPMMWQGEFSVMQMFPWFGTLSARENYSTALADADFLEIEIAKRKIVKDLSLSYYRLYEIIQKQEVVDANIELLQAYEQMALTSVEVGNASAVAVLRLQIRQNKLRERKQVLAQNYEAERTVFNKLLNREKDANIAIVDSLIIPKKDTEIDFEKLRLHPKIKKINQLNKIVSQADALNQKESGPQLGVGMEYMYFTEMPDMFMPMVSVSIPLFNKKYKSVARQNKLRYDELDKQEEAVENNLLTQLQTAVKSRNVARIRVQTQKENLKQAKDAEDILLKSYETGTINFNDVLDIQELQLEFGLKLIEAVQAYYTQLAIIAYYTTN